MKVQKGTFRQIFILALLIINICLLMACGSNNSSTEDEESEESTKELTLTELLREDVDQSILEYWGTAHHNNYGIDEYRLCVVSDSNEAVAEEIKNVYQVMENYLQSDAYEGGAISVVIYAESIHCHAHNILAVIGNSDYSYNYYGKKENLTIEDHVSYIEPYGIDDESEIYDENVDYIINQESYWDSFDVDCIVFDYFNRE